MIKLCRESLGSTSVGAKLTEIFPDPILLETSREKTFKVPSS